MKTLIRVFMGVMVAAAIIAVVVVAANHYSPVVVEWVESKLDTIITTPDTDNGDKAGDNTTTPDVTPDTDNGDKAGNTGTTDLTTPDTETTGDTDNTGTDVTTDTTDTDNGDKAEMAELKAELDAVKAEFEALKAQQAADTPVVGKVVTDDGWNAFIGTPAEAREFFDSLTLQEALDFAANSGKYYQVLPEEATRLGWSPENLPWSGKLELYRLGNKVPLCREDGTVESSPLFTGRVETMADAEAVKALCTHGKLPSNWITAEVRANSSNWRGTLTEKDGFTNPGLTKALDGFETEVEVGGVTYTGWCLGWDGCPECTARISATSSGSSSGSGSSSSSSSGGTTSSGKKSDSRHSKSTQGRTNPPAEQQAATSDSAEKNSVITFVQEKTEAVESTQKVPTTDKDEVKSDMEFETWVDPEEGGNSVSKGAHNPE